METTELSSRQRLAPVVTLLVISPLMAEVMFGATHLTTLFLLVPEICIYGGAALMIRDAVRRQKRNWVATLLMGIAFSILLECVILQTSVSPMLFGGDPGQIYSWVFGVNWVYLLWSVAYESVWAIVLPIRLTELIFPDRREEPWVGKKGLAATGAAFMLASAVVWYRFTQTGIAPGKAYEAPWPVVLTALIAAIVCGAAAFAPWSLLRRIPVSDRSAPRPWLVGLAAFWLSLPWFMLPVLVFAGPPSLPIKFPIVIGLVWAAGSLFLAGRWSASPDWGDSHRLALILGALTASMLAGYLESGIQLPVDLIGKLVLNVMAVLLLIYLAGRVRRRTI